MSQASSSSSFRSLFDAALQDYTSQTGTRLEGHRFATQFETCSSVESISSILQEHAQAFHEFRGEGGKIIKALKSTVHILYTFSIGAVFSEGLSLVRLKMLIASVFPSNVYSIAIPTCKGNICRLRGLAHSTSISPSPLTYPCDTSVNQAVKNVSESYDALVDLFESIGNFLSRLEIYTKIPLTEAMREIVIKIMVEVLSTLALATKQVNQGRLSESCLR